MSQIQLYIPNNPPELIEKVMATLKDTLLIKHMILLKGDNNSLIILRRTKTGVTEVMGELSKIGVGTEFGIIDILPLNVSIPEMASTENKKNEIGTKEIIKDRVSIEEIQKNIREISNPDMNYILFITLAAFIASVGLIMNSSLILIASMILSPFMGPILGVSFGIITKNKEIKRNSINGQLIGLGIGFFIGIFMGLLTKIIIPSFIPTTEMTTRDFPHIFDIIIAICAGIAVGFCITASIQSTLVGIAIAVALLPPIVNSGMNLVMGEFMLSLGSLTLSLTNIVIINICAFSIFKLKQIRSIPFTSIFWKGPEETIRKKIESEIQIPESLSLFSRFKNKFKKLPIKPSK